MFDFDSFDMNMDGNVDGIDFLGFDYLMRHVLEPDQDEDHRDARDAPDLQTSPSGDDSDEWDDDEETEGEDDSWYDYDVSAEVCGSDANDYCDDYSTRHPSSTAEQDFAETYEGRARQWRERAPPVYGIPQGRQRTATEKEWRHPRAPSKSEIGAVPPEPPPDEWLRGEFNQLTSGCVDTDNRAKHERKRWRYHDEPPDQFWEQWADELDDYDLG